MAIITATNNNVFKGIITDSVWSGITYSIIRYSAKYPNKTTADTKNGVFVGKILSAYILYIMKLKTLDNRKAITAPHTPIAGIKTNKSMALKKTELNEAKELNLVLFFINTRVALNSEFISEKISDAIIKGTILYAVWNLSFVSNKIISLEKREKANPTSESAIK
ncbi:MAG: hypothetical protein ABFD82_22095 [Syntrophaceae bacterium]